MPDWSVARLEEIDEIDDGREPFRSVRHHLGIRAFGITAWTAREAGDRLINEHREDGPGDGEELYVVMSGHATFELDGERQDAPAGTFVRVGPGVLRTAYAVEAGTTLLAVGGGREGEPYVASGWELFSPLMPLLTDGDYETVADRAQSLLSDERPYGNVYYNTACAEARAGRREDAIAHVRRSFELMPSLREIARDDEDLASIRDAISEMVDSTTPRAG